ncbi:hypothetical protein G9A89_019695 [Geosiphon pyriformis]|nr:hypothetical protein G9A89_019695 [Geosiphon pyriformis]
MELVSSSAGGFGSGSTGLGICPNTKKKQVDSVYSCGASFKKPKKPETSGGMVDSSAGPLNLLNIGNSGMEPAVSWDNEVGSVASSISGLSDMENMENMVTEETSYADLVAFEHGENENKTMPRKTRIQTYVLGHPPKVPTFDNMSDDDDVLMLPFSKFASSVLLIKSHAADTCSFKPVKFFTLDIKLSAVPGKTNSNKLIAASTLSKFPDIIKSFFTSELSLKKAREMVINEKIFVNNDIRKVNSSLDQEVIVKEILVDLFRSAIEAVFSKFSRIVSIKLQLIGFWQKALVEYKSSEMANLIIAQWSVLVRKNSVRVAKAINNKQTALLYTLPTGTTAYDLSGLLELYSEKTCFIGWNPSSYVRDRCIIICFGNEVSKLVAIGSVLVFKGANLHWTGLSLVCCTACKQFGHVSGVCFVDNNSESHGKCVISDQDQILADQVSGILKKLSFVDLVSLASLSNGVSPVVSVFAASVVGLDMALNDGSTLSVFPFSGTGKSAAVLSSSGSRVLTSKVDGLEFKMSALEALIGAVLVRLDLLCSNLGHPLPSSSQ